MTGSSLVRPAFPSTTPAVIAGLLLLTFASAAAAQRCPLPAAVLEDFPLDGAMAHVRYLADDALGGREVATAGERCASVYIVEAFREAGLAPWGPDRSYFHGFPVRTGTVLGPSRLLGPDAAPLAQDGEWTALAVSASATVTAPLVYAGYGVSRPGVDDRSTAADLTGRVAVVEWGDPDSPSGASLRSDPAFKARVAAGRGATGLIALLPPAVAVPDVTGEAGEQLDIPVVVVSDAVAEELRADAERGDTVTVVTDVRATHTEARNVVAMLPGTVPAAETEYVVVGAHYDHLGRASSVGPARVYNGADDNASGTAALLEIAWRLRSAQLDRTLVFVAFTGEEQGLWGATHFVEDDVVPLHRTLAMVNLDMVGRLGNDPLQIHGTGTAADWVDLVDGANATLPAPLTFEQTATGAGPSDHAVYNAAGVPVLHFFTGTHEDYHRPTDDWERVDQDGLERVIGLATEVIRRLADLSVTPRLTPTDAPRN